MKISVSIRFYEELNDFLSPEKRKTEFKVSLKDRPSIKKLIESLGVPHREVDLILINGRSVPFSFLLRDQDRISVYPMFEAFDISTVTKLRDKPLRKPKFILDTDLGELANYLRDFGFDALYRNDYAKSHIVDRSIVEKRTILTKSRKLLLRKGVVRGYRVKSIKPSKQFDEIIRHFDLKI